MSSKGAILSIVVGMVTGVGFGLVCQALGVSNRWSLVGQLVWSFAAMLATAALIDWRRGRLRSTRG